MIVKVTSKRQVTFPPKSSTHSASSPATNSKSNRVPTASSSAPPHRPNPACAAARQAAAH